MPETQTRPKRKFGNTPKAGQKAPATRVIPPPMTAADRVAEAARLARIRALGQAFTGRNPQNPANVNPLAGTTHNVPGVVLPGTEPIDTGQVGSSTSIINTQPPSPAEQAIIDEYNRTHPGNPGASDYTGTYGNPIQAVGDVQPGGRVYYWRDGTAHTTPEPLAVAPDGTPTFSADVASTPATPMTLNAVPNVAGGRVQEVASMFNTQPTIYGTTNPPPARPIVPTGLNLTNARTYASTPAGTGLIDQIRNRIRGY